MSMSRSWGKQVSQEPCRRQQEPAARQGKELLACSGLPRTLCPWGTKAAPFSSHPTASSCKPLLFSIFSSSTLGGDAEILRLLTFPRSHTPSTPSAESPFCWVITFPPFSTDSGDLGQSKKQSREAFITCGKSSLATRLLHSSSEDLKLWRGKVKLLFHYRHC